MQPNAACSVFGPAHLFSIIRRWQFRAWLETDINMCLALLNTIFPFVFGPVLTLIGLQHELGPTIHAGFSQCFKYIYSIKTGNSHISGASASKHK
jgi:hypothetical protein